MLIHIFILLFQRGAYHWEKVEEEFYRMHQVSVSSPCIKSLYQLFLLSNCIESSISSLGIKSPYQVFHVKSLHQFSVSILCIKSLHHIFMFSRASVRNFRGRVQYLLLRKGWRKGHANILIFEAHFAYY